MTRVFDHRGVGQVHAGMAAHDQMDSGDRLYELHILRVAQVAQQDDHVVLG